MDGKRTLFFTDLKKAGFSKEDGTNASLGK